MSAFRQEFEQLHGDEMERLSNIHDAGQLKDNAFAAIFKSNKFNVCMSAYSFQLLISFLQEQKSFLFIKIINQYVKIRSTISY
jgi:WD40 associated region in TFIID subunit, NTD2 domain